MADGRFRLTAGAGEQGGVRENQPAVLAEELLGQHVEVSLHLGAISSGWLSSSCPMKATPAAGPLHHSSALAR